MRGRSLFFLLSTTMIAAGVVGACSSTNGDPIPPEVYDAEALDAGGNPEDPDGGSKTDGAPSDSGKDAASDAGKDAPVTAAAVVINELYVDRIGDGDGSEFVELRADPGTPVDDLKLRIIYPDGKVKYEVNVGNAGDKVGPSGLWVVGGPQTFRLNVTDRVDRQVAVSVWGLDYPGAVQLMRGITLLDVVGFTNEVDGGPVTADPGLSAPKNVVETKPALIPDNAGATSTTKRRSFGRKAGAVDTNNNATDFCKMEASPGFAQKACE